MAIVMAVDLAALPTDRNGELSQTLQRGDMGVFSSEGKETNGIRGRGKTVMQ
jgi:hypothetical protein